MTDDHPGERDYDSTMEPLDADCVFLAAGTSSRMGASKQLLLLEGKPLFLHGLERALEICRRVILVTGAADLSGWIPAEPRLTAAHNPDYRQGQLSSLQRGLGECRRDRIFVMLADLPLVRRETYRLLWAALEEGPAVYPVCQGRRGHPVLLGREAADRILRASPGEKAMEVIRPLGPRPVETEDPGIFRDADTPGDWEELKKSFPGPEPGGG